MYQQDVLYTVIILGQRLTGKQQEELSTIVYSVCTENMPEHTDRVPDVWVSANPQDKNWLLRGAVSKDNFGALRQALGGALISLGLEGVITIRLEQMREGSHLYSIKGRDEEIYTMSTVRT